MTTRQLDQLVKGAPPSHTNVEAVAEKASTSRSSTPQTADPTSLLPSSPPQIYLNLLILEASLRQQYLTLRARKRQHTWVVASLALWNAWFFYLQFLRPREDGSGIGGSVYWLVDMGEKMALIGGVVMVVLFWATGQWERGMRWPRKWLGTTNRGLRTMNCKIIIVKGPWWKELFSHLSFLMPLQGTTPGSSYHFVEFMAHERRQQHTQGRRALEWAEEDVADGGDHVKLLLLPKQFTPDFRENWEVYRTEYWGQENNRRAELRKRIRMRDRELAKQQGGWFWWSGWRGWASLWGLHSSRPPREITPPHHVHSLAHQASIRDKHRRRPSAVKEWESHSRSSSRSSITSADNDLRERRWSTASSGSAGGASRRRSKLLESTEMARSGSSSTRPLPRLAPKVGSRPATPNPELKTRSSTLSTASDSSSFKTTPTPDPVIKAEPAD